MKGRDNSEEKSLIAFDDLAERQEEPVDWLARLPRDVALIILTKLPWQDLVSMSQTSKRMNEFAKMVNIYFQPIQITMDAEGQPLEHPKVGYVVGNYNQLARFFKIRDAEEKRLAQLDNKCFINANKEDLFAKGATVNLCANCLPCCIGPIIANAVLGFTSYPAAIFFGFLGGSATHAIGLVPLFICTSIVGKNQKERQELRAVFGAPPTEARLAGATFQLLYVNDDKKDNDGPPVRITMG